MPEKERERVQERESAVSSWRGLRFLACGAWAQE